MPDKDVRGYQALLKILGCRLISEEANVSHFIGGQVGYLPDASRYQRIYRYLCSVARHRDPDLELSGCIITLKNLKFIVVDSLASEYRIGELNKRVEKRALYYESNVYVHQGQEKNHPAIAIALAGVFGEVEDRIRSDFALLAEQQENDKCEDILRALNIPLLQESIFEPVRDEYRHEQKEIEPEVEVYGDDSGSAGEEQIDWDHEEIADTTLAIKQIERPIKGVIQRDSDRARDIHHEPGSSKTFTIKLRTPVQIDRQSGRDSGEEGESIQIGNLGVQKAMEYERKNGRTPRDVSETSGLGYDIESTGEAGKRYIEVKSSRQRRELIQLEPSQLKAALQYRACYFIYVIEFVDADPIIYELQDPISDTRLEWTVANIIGKRLAEV